MPPRAMFVSKFRPSGFEFAACHECNKGTSAADLVASFFARLNRSYDGDRRLIVEARALRNKVAQLAPGILEEFFKPGKRQQIWLRDKRSLASPFIQIKADGPATRAYLTVFAAKFGMALYRRHIGHALPLTGGVHVNWYLNAGLAQKTAEAILSILPVGGTLQQGTFQVAEQFAYKYNHDERTIAAALAGFHWNLHVFAVATSLPEFFKLPFPIPYSDFVRPGELVSRIPRKIMRPQVAS